MKNLIIIALFFISQSCIAQNKAIKNITIADYLSKTAAKAKKKSLKANHLINQQSPYLLQHAYNPVDWYPWGEEAFALAKKENKPIFLSIGYSTCHWCHVMAKESFENKKIANFLNKNFISVKVDRELRPDVDDIYMAATQLISGHGGWPMSVFLDNKLRPFHAATYYPPFSNEKAIGFYQVLKTMDDLWKNKPELVQKTATEVTQIIRAKADEAMAHEKLALDIKEKTLQQIASVFDEDFGGFSQAPKFFNFGIFNFLNQLTLEESTNENLANKKMAKQAQQMMKTTLDAIASGGIYDQLSGGFHRYSVDATWQVPHFEKMLYSQGLMSLAYSRFYKINPDLKYKKIVEKTIQFLNTEMRSDEGGYYSALDADSGFVSDERDEKSQSHKEGAYYLWQQRELKEILSDAEFDFIKNYYHIRENGNIFSDPNNEFDNLNILYVDEEYKNEILNPQQQKWLDSANKKLAVARLKHARPTLDDKIITAWNAMVVVSLVDAAISFNNDDFLKQAIATALFIKTKLYDNKNKRLYRQYRNKEASHAANLADYAWLIKAVLAIYQKTKDSHWLGWALELQSLQKNIFLDEKSGVYFNSVAGDMSLLFRSKTIFDGALPSPNAIVLSNLFSLSKQVKLKNQQQLFLKQAQKLMASFAQVVNDNPLGATMFVSVVKNTSQTP